MADRTPTNSPEPIQDAQAWEDLQQAVNRNAGQAINQNSGQAVQHNLGQAIGEMRGGTPIAQMTGGIVIGQMVVYGPPGATAGEAQPAAAAAPTTLGDNPYQGLKAFRETDGDRFFGRDRLIAILRDRFAQLHADRTAVRVLPIYGPSGSGKSSLARAGLIPALGRQPVPGGDRAQVAVLLPGNHPLEALGTVLARIATHDPTPVAKTREFTQELAQPNAHGDYDGLRRIANVLPEIDHAPLIVLVDQFEEVYTLCADAGERWAFVATLLAAAQDPTQRVSVIVTMRSDFLGATQQQPALNHLFSEQGFLVPAMQPAELAEAIAQPARRAGYDLNPAVVQLLVEETQGQEGALPLLQFALMQIWEGLREGTDPAATLARLGGVGGALANEAQRLYGDLTPEQQRVARSVFLALIQFHEDGRYTRRRALLSELIHDQQPEPVVRSVIDRFARPGVWILIMSANAQHLEMVEVAHEALIQSWAALGSWLTDQGEALRHKRKIENAAAEWMANGKSPDYLLQGRSLRHAREFQSTHHHIPETSLSQQAFQFIRRSDHQRKIALLKILSITGVVPLIGALLIVHFYLLGQVQIVFKENKECEVDISARPLLRYMIITKQKRDKLNDSNLCREQLQDLNLSDFDFFQTNFTSANLQNSNLSHAFLVKANFQKANLIMTNFQNASLSQANFEDSILYKTDFRNSDILDDQLRKAQEICEVFLPSKSKLDPNRDCN